MRSGLKLFLSDLRGACMRDRAFPVILIGVLCFAILLTVEFQAAAPVVAAIVLLGALTALVERRPGDPR